MPVRRNYRINLRNYGNPPAIMVSQYDENYDLVFEVYDGVVPATGLNAYTVKLVGRQPGDDPALKYEFTGTVSGIANNILSFTIDTTMTGRAGKGTAEIVILDTTNDVKFASFNLPVYVEKAAVPDDAIDADVERAQEIADEVQDIVDTAAAEVKGEAEAWAVGQRDGEDVPSTDPAYHNNAKYYSEVAQDIADSIGIDATLSISGKAADAKKTGDEISSLKEDLNAINTATSDDVGKALKVKTVTNGKVAEWEFGAAGGSSGGLDAIAVEYPVNATWTQGYIKSDGSTGNDQKSCYTDYIESDGGDITVKMGSGYRSKVARYNSSKTFAEMLYDSSTDDKTISIQEGDYVRIQVSSNSNLTPPNINNSVIAASKIMYTAMSYNKAVGKPADSYDVYTIIGNLLNTDSAEYTITSGYYSKANGEAYSNSQYAKTNKQSGLAGKAIHVVVGSDYKFTMRFWDGDTYDASKSTEYTQDGVFYVPTGYKVACNFMRADGATMSSSDLTAIASSFHIYVASSGSAFEDVVLGSTADFNSLTETGTYRAPSTYVASYTNCPTTDYGRLIVFNSASDGYSCVQIYVSYNNKVYTRILQVLNTSTWSTWTMLGGGASGGDTGYLHDGDILRMASDPEAIPVDSEHLGYTAFMAATWETLLPSGYTDGDSYNASTTKIINVHVSRQTNWQSTAYGSNIDTYPIYRYIFTPVNGYSKTVFLSAGCHGNEAEGYWGLYRLMKMIYFEGYKYPTLRNLRDNVRFIIVPCWNPWGLEHYRRFNAFENDNYQAWKWLYASNHQVTVNGTVYGISDVGEADVIYDTITDYADYINLWLDLHTDPYAGRTTSSSDGIDDPRGYTPPYGFYGFAKNGSATKTQLCAVMEDFYNILKNEHSFTETWHLQGVNANATSGYSPWMMSLSFPAALVEVSTFMHNFTYASGTAGMMKLAQEYYGNCLAELLRVT